MFKLICAIMYNVNDTTKDDHSYNVVKQFPGCKTILNMANGSVLKNNYTNVCRTTVKGNMNLDDRYVNVCETLKGSLKFFHARTGGYENNTYCEFLSFWLNEQLRTLQDSTYDTSTFYTKISDNDKENSSILNLCQNKIYHLTEREYSNISNLYKLHEEFGLFKTKIGSGSTHNISCENAKNCSELYYRIISECIPESSSSICKELNDIRVYFESKNWLIGKTICSKVKPLLPAEEYQKEIQKRVMEAAESESIYLKPSVVSSAITFGIILCLLILYKFTAFGSCINRNILRKKKNSYNFYKDGKYQNLESNMESRNIKFNNNSQHIAYYPIRN